MQPQRIMVITARKKYMHFFIMNYCFNCSTFLRNNDVSDVSYLFSQAPKIHNKPNRHILTLFFLTFFILLGQGYDSHPNLSKRYDNNFSVAVIGSHCSLFSIFKEYILVLLYSLPPISSISTSIVSNRSFKKSLFCFL